MIPSKYTTQEIWSSISTETGAKSREGGYNYLSTESVDPNKAPLKKPSLNREVHVECATTRNALDSAMEAELGSLFVNCQRGAATHMVIIKMGHTQPPTPAVTDSTTGYGLVNDNILQWRSRAIGMQFTGSEIDSDKDNFWYIGWPENKICQTISQITTLPATIDHSGAHISSPQRMPVSKHATCHLLTREGVLNTSLPGETDNVQTKYPSSMVRKIVDRQTETNRPNMKPRYWRR